MFIFFFILWIIFNGRITVEILVTGAVITAAVSFFFYRLLGWSLKKDGQILRNLPLLLLYVLNLFREVVIAAFQVLALVWSPSRRPDPVLVEFHSGLSGSFSNVLLANSITLTPGTFTIEQEDDRFVIHCLRPEFAEGLADCSFIRLLRRIRT